MIKLTFAFKVLGLLSIISGGFIGAIGYFRVSNKSLHDRTLLYFYNEEHFHSLLIQKYSEITGFVMIAIGSLIEFLIVVIGFENLYLYINARLYLLLSIIFFISLLVFICFALNTKTKTEINKIRVPIELYDYQKHYRGTKESDIATAKYNKNKLAERLKLSKKINLESIEPEKITEFAIEYCKRNRVGYRTYSPTKDKQQ